MVGMVLADTDSLVGGLPGTIPTNAGFVSGVGWNSPGADAQGQCEPVGVAAQQPRRVFWFWCSCGWDGRRPAG